MTSRTALALGLALTTLSAPALAQDVAIKAGWLVVEAEADPIQGGVVVIRDGRVVAAGADVKVPEGVTLLERPGSWVVPGFVDARSHLGLRGDLDERAAPLAPDVDLATRIDRSHPDFVAHRAAGITTALLAPGDRALFAGTGVVLKTTGAVLEGGRVAKLCLTEAAAAAGPPTSLGGRLELLRRSLREAHGDPTSGGFGAFARGDLPGLVTVREPAGLQALLELGPRYGLRLAFDLQADYSPAQLEALDLSGVTVVLQPSALEAPEARRRYAARLAARGARVAIASYAPFAAPGSLRLAAVQAAEAGLSPRLALAALTSVPAAALGLDGVVGALAPGCHGDLVVLSGAPLDLRARVEEVYVAGRQVRRAGGEE